MTDKTEAVRLVLAEGGDMPNEALAEAVKARFGMEMKPGIVAVLRATLRWREIEAAKRAERELLADAQAEREGRCRRMA